MAERVGEEYGRTLAGQMSPGDSQRSLRTAMHAIADTLTAHGFAAHAEDQGATTAVVADNCPFGDAASQYPVLCAVDRGMVKGLLAGLCGDDPAVRPGGPVVVAGPRRRRLRRRGLTGGRRGPPLPRSRLHDPAPPRGRGPPWPAGPTGRHRRPRDGSTPRDGWSGPRWRTPGNRWPGSFGVRPRQVVFTSGGTEAVNAAVWGAGRDTTAPAVRSSLRRRRALGRT